jgi:alginate O-acetyltransferase complex protein AlgI
VTSNLSLLGFFKYFNFAVGSWNSLATALGIEAATIDSALRVTLPLGISFYTFQSMSYAIDVYRGDAKPFRNFIDFACFVSMFPQLVAGPIIRFAEVAEQLASRKHTLAKFARGVAFFAVGLAKKILIANPCGRIADTVFDAAAPTALQAWHGVVGYAFQIYFDFSGYSDMAIGLGLMLGFVFARNFNSPYHSQSITEFWRRWHISLSTWLRDYLYLPLGGNRKGPGRTYVNLALTMLLGGLWHGAAWNFVVWGAFHGALLAVERAVGIERLYGWMPKPLRVANTFALVLVSWVFFRAADLPAAVDYLGRMFGVGPSAATAPLVGGLLLSPYLLLCFALAAVVVWAAPQSWYWTRDLGPWKVAAVLSLLVVAVGALSTQDYNPFIYYIF